MNSKRQQQLHCDPYPEWKSSGVTCLLHEDLPSRHCKSSTNVKYGQASHSVTGPMIGLQAASSCLDCVGGLVVRYLSRGREGDTEIGPEDQWTHAYTDGSAAEATRDGGGGVYIRYNDEIAQITIATGKYSTNFKAEAEALKKATIEIRNNLPRTKPNVVIFTDALSVLSKLHTPHQKDLSEVETALVDLAAQTNLILQWIPAHCGIQGNEQADRFAREGGQLEQEDRYTTFSDEKTIIKTLSKKIWKQQHPKYNQSDSLHKLNRTEQVENWTQQT